jgi:hypothetical protein
MTASMSIAEIHEHLGALRDYCHGLDKRVGKDDRIPGALAVEFQALHYLVDEILIVLQSQYQPKGDQMEDRPKGTPLPADPGEPEMEYVEKGEKVPSRLETVASEPEPEATVEIDTDIDDFEQLAKRALNAALRIASKGDGQNRYDSGADALVSIAAEARKWARGDEGDKATLNATVTMQDRS